MQINSTASTEHQDKAFPTDILAVKQASREPNTSWFKGQL